MFLSAASRPSSTTSLEPLFQYIEEHQDEFVQKLGEWVSVQSDSSTPALWGEVERVLSMTADRITAMGGVVEHADIGAQQVENDTSEWVQAGCRSFTGSQYLAPFSTLLRKLPDGQSVRRPPVILAQFHMDPEKATLCIYGHVDVQPAKKEDGWDTDPYTLTELNGNLYGRGATDNKGPVLAWLHAIETYQATSQELPVNIKLIIEGLEEVGSDGLEELTWRCKDSFFSDVDYIVISDNVWATRRPALTYGTRGSSYFFVEVKGPKTDLHSGVFGGLVHEPMMDLIALLDSLLGHTGKILVPGLNEMVAPVTKEERKLYKGIHFDLEEMKKEIGVQRFLQDSKEGVLMARWRYPSLSIHGIEGAVSIQGSQTVIPKQVVGKFSIRLVPHMEPAVVERQVKEHLHGVFAQLNSPNRLRVTSSVGARPWMADLKDPQYVAGCRAVEVVFGVEPELIREGSTIPIAHNFHKVTGKSVMMLPIGGHDDGEHSQKEKISRYNFIQGTKIFVAYFHELSMIHKSLPQNSA